MKAKLCSLILLHLHIVQAICGCPIKYFYFLHGEQLKVSFENNIASYALIYDWYEFNDDSSNSF